MQKSTGIVKYLEGLGYTVSDLSTPMDPHVNRWWSYLVGNADFFTRVEVDEDGRENKVPIRSCRPAEMVTSDMAAMIYNERSSISIPDDELGVASAWLDEWLNQIWWHDRAPLTIKRMCDTGTAAWALHVRGASETGKSNNLSVVPMRYDARSIIPLSWEADSCQECAFIADVYIDGEQCTQLEVHRVGDDGNYVIHCAFFNSKGERFSRDGYPQGFDGLKTRQPIPTFALIRLAIDNPYWDYSPMGVALFDNAIDVLETVDMAFNNIGNDIFLGRKLLGLPEQMMRKDETTGRMRLPWMAGQQFFLGTKSNTYDGKMAVFEYNPSLRADENRQMLATALQMLGKKVGFGTKCYALDSQGGITTAKQVASDNAEMMRTIRRHEHLIRPAVAQIVEAAAGIYNQLSMRAVGDLSGGVEVVLGDSIMQDDDSLRERDRADVAAGLLEPWRYMVRWQGYTEADAKAATGADATQTIPLEV